ncbi:MAG: hypothetical protein EOP51_04075 [Sphingobacteriales bacterium]|nr:MAG: hypothetical protein EOP51_04075 [Sphingobacteriales bacterium]
MQWFDNKFDLQYYHQPEGVPCYCEALVKPADMMLQGMLPSVAGNGYTMHIDVYSADGNTFYEHATTYFKYFFGSIPDGRRYFNAQLKSYSPAMCLHECFVLNVYVTNNAGGQVFNQWTERYCIADCCDEVTAISFTQSDVTAPFKPAPINVGISGNGNGTFGPVIPTGPITPTAPAKGPTSNCGEAYVTVTSWFDCYDKFTGDYYGDPKDTYSGSAFQYRKITNIKGLVRTLPREIKREYSMNCRLQRVESTTQYQLIGFDLFAQWKMREMEDQLHASHIVVNNYDYINRSVEYAGGTPFKLVQVGFNCTPTYKLDATLNDCTVNQVFGCGDVCNTQGSTPLGMVIPAAQGLQQYYDENKKYLGNTTAELINYYGTRPGVETVEVLDVEDYDCNFTTAFIVYGMQYIPTSVYVNGVRPRNRVYGLNIDDMNDICRIVKPACAIPYIGTVIIEATVCATPVIGSIIYEAYAAETLYISSLGDWELNSSDSLATRSQNIVVLKFDVFDGGYTYDSSDPDAEIPFVTGEVAYISAAGWPSRSWSFTHSNIDSIPDGGELVIQTDGHIYYSGPATYADLLGSRIQITNIIYTL